MHAHLFDFIHDTIVVAVRCQAAARSQPKVLLAQSIPTVHVTRPSLRCLEESFEKLADWTNDGVLTKLITHGCSCSTGGQVSSFSTPDILAQP